MSISGAEEKDALASVAHQSRQYPDVEAKAEVEVEADDARMTASALWLASRVAPHPPITCVAFRGKENGPNSIWMGQCLTAGGAICSSKGNWAFGVDLIDQRIKLWKGSQVLFASSEWTNAEAFCIGGNAADYGPHEYNWYNDEAPYVFVSYDGGRSKAFLDCSSSGLTSAGEEAYLEINHTAEIDNTRMPDTSVVSFQDGAGTSSLWSIDAWGAAQTNSGCKWRTDAVGFTAELAAGEDFSSQMDELVALKEEEGDATADEDTEDGTRTKGSKSPKSSKWSAPKIDGFRFCRVPGIPPEGRRQVETKSGVSYQCVGREYDECIESTEYVATNAASFGHFPDWGKTNVPLVRSSSNVLFIGNSHTRQVLETLACQYDDDILVSKETHYEMKRDIKLYKIINSPFVYSAQWPQLIEEYLERSLDSFDAIVLGTFNDVSKTGGTKFYRDMAEAAQENSAINLAARPPDLVDFASFYNGPIISVTMVSQRRANDRQGYQNTQTLADKITTSAGRQTVWTVDGNRYIPNIGQCAHTGNRHFVKEATSDDYGHRCVGGGGGHPDLLAWDVVEALAEAQMPQISMKLHENSSKEDDDFWDRELQGISVPLVGKKSKASKRSTNGKKIKKEKNGRSQVAIDERVAFGNFRKLEGSHFQGHFSKYLTTSQSFEDCRKNWKNDLYASTHDLELVRLPANITGIKDQLTISEFQDISDELIGRHLASKAKGSKVAVVEVCIRMDICALSKANHQNYCDQHGYDYLLLEEAIPQVHPKFVKYLALSWALRQSYDWVLMLDADSLFSSPETSIQSLVEEKMKLSDETSLVMTRGGRWEHVNVINNGIFLLRNTPWSKQHVFDIFTTKTSFTRFLGRSMLDQPIQASILVAQEEISWPPQSLDEHNRNVRIVDPAMLSSFKRGEQLVDQDIVDGIHWKEGNFAAHFASEIKYSLMIDHLIETKQQIPVLEDRFPFPIPVKGEATKTGLCWTDVTSPAGIKCIPKYHIIGSHKNDVTILLDQLNYLPNNIFGPSFRHDHVHWFTDSSSKSMTSRCDKRRYFIETQLETKFEQSVHLRSPKNQYTGVQTCSYEDYVLLYSNLLPVPTNTSMYRSTERILIDELAIWDNTFRQVRGISLPDLLHAFQPSSKLIVALSSPSAEALYASYTEAKYNGEGVAVAPMDFERDLDETIAAWNLGGCRVENYSTCLPRALVMVGGLLTRYTFAPYLKAWLSSFGCSNVLVFDSNASNAGLELVRLQSYLETELRFKPQMVKKREQRYEVEGTATQISVELLDSFYEPHNKEVCELVEVYPCLQLTVFQQLCK